MTGEIKGKIKNIFLNRWFSLGCIFLFTLINWLKLIQLTNLGPPDYYEYYQYAQKLLSGDFQLKVIPPLFPFILGVLGKLFVWIFRNSDSVILAGRFIALFSGYIILYFTYRWLETFIGKMALLGIILIAISPFYLKILALPLTDNLFLALVVMSFYYFFENRLLLSGVAVTLAILIRFEGLLLFFCGLIRYLRLKLKHMGLMLAVTLILLSNLLYLSFKYTPRILQYLQSTFSRQFYLYFIHHPLKLGQILYGNLLYFIPRHFPNMIKLMLFYFFLLLFGFGLYKLFKKSFSFGLSITLYMVIFILAKGGYVANVGVNRLHERRLLSFLYLFFLIAFMGLVYLLKWIKSQKWKIIWTGSRILLALSLSVLIISIPLAGWRILLTLLLLMPPLWFTLRRYKSFKYENWIAFGLAIILIGGLYLKGLRQTAPFVKASSNRGGYCIAQWLNREYSEQSGRVALYSHREMVEYYLDQPVDIKKIGMRNKPSGENEEHYWKEFLTLLKNNHIRLVIFDDYLEGKFERTDRTIKEMLRREISRNRYFKVIEYLRYNKRPVAAVVEPNYNHPEIIANEK